MFDSDEDGDFTESSIFDLDSAPPPPDGQHSPRSRRWKQPGGSLTNALPVRARAFSAPSVRSSSIPGSRQVAFAATRESEKPLGMYGSNHETNSSYPLETDGEDDQDLIIRDDDDEDNHDEDDEQNSYTVWDEEQHDLSHSGHVDVTPTSRTSAEFMEDELDLASGEEPSPAQRVSSHDVSSSRWSDSEFQSNGESGEDTPSSTRSLPWGNDFSDCCSSDFISWNRTFSTMRLTWSSLLTHCFCWCRRRCGSCQQSPLFCLYTSCAEYIPLSVDSSDYSLCYFCSCPANFNNLVLYHLGEQIIGGSKYPNSN